jgi:hypothetical protein
MVTILKIINYLAKKILSKNFYGIIGIEKAGDDGLDNSSKIRKDQTKT